MGRPDRPASSACSAGTAPVSYQSGQVHKVNIRRGCNKNLRHKNLRHSMYLFADKITEKTLFNR